MIIRGVDYNGKYKEGFFHVGMECGVRRFFETPIDFAELLAEVINSPENERINNFGIFCEGLICGVMAAAEGELTKSDFDEVDRTTPEPFTSEHFPVKDGTEQIIIKMNCFTDHPKREWVEEFPPLYSLGILRTGELDTYTDEYWYTDRVFYRDYAGNNLIYAWLSNREDVYPNRTPSAVMDYLDNEVLGDATLDIQDMLENERDTLVYIDCPGGLVPGIHFSEGEVSKLGIDLHSMTDEEIYAALSSPQSQSDTAMNDNVRAWYLNKFPEDSIAAEMKDCTFQEVLDALKRGDCVYEVWSCHDTVIRERVFEELSYRQSITACELVDMWMNNIQPSNSKL